MADQFDIYHPARLESKVLEDIWQQAYGDSYAEDAKPNGLCSSSALEHIIAAGPHVSRRNLLDIGCGNGWTSLFRAQHMGTNLLGTDVSPVDIELARKEAANRDITARFWIADVSSPGLADGVYAIVTCLDVLPTFLTKQAFLKEMH